MSNVTSDHNILHGLRLAHGQVVVDGSANSFSSNTQAGIYATNLDSILSVKNATINSNSVHGVGLLDTGSVTITSSTISENTSYALTADNAKSVNLLNTTMNSNTNTVLFVIGGSIINISNASSIAFTGTPRAEYAILVQENSSVVIDDDHISLQGDINTGLAGDSSSISIKIRGETTTYNTPNTILACDYKNGTGSCKVV
ncbi:MAG: hypothetical protein EXR81_02015 [Gammaproteobacteria bacterium]|nr:hypothetical protein [Gammaproteobacteria bacterium]